MNKIRKDKHSRKEGERNAGLRKIFLMDKEKMMEKSDWKAGRTVCDITQERHNYTGLEW